MSGFEAERVPTGNTGQATDTKTVNGTFTDGADASLNMSGIDDMGGDDGVVIYAATSENPIGRRTGTADRRADYAPAPATFPTSLDGGAWAVGQNYWVQVVDTNSGVTTTWQGSLSPTLGTHDIVLRKQTF